VSQAQPFVALFLSWVILGLFVYSFILRFQFRISKVEVSLAFRSGEGNRYELTAIYRLVGEFYLTKEDEIEARGVSWPKLLAFVYTAAGGRR
jgi:hypothetical protein